MLPGFAMPHSAIASPDRFRLGPAPMLFDAIPELARSAPIGIATPATRIALRIAEL
ncbi:hypothetical protein SAMN06265373_102611 [Shimia sagamensis]|uniref:Uncharacterized protein n=1 Tax=Shimia sagamensis TaxID=1566352 RepID=A0ABY1NNC5_9RHOB|nr:hypothetical protein SAMN06265373_102611 [Shimia sagamensis]